MEISSNKLFLTGLKYYIYMILMVRILLTRKKKFRKNPGTTTVNVQSQRRLFTNKSQTKVDNLKTAYNIRDY